MVFTASFYFAIFLKVFSEIEIDVSGLDYFTTDVVLEDDDHTEDRFITAFRLYPKEKTTFQIFIIYLYYSFTSLTTVGFGDYHPKSNLERVMVSIGLMFGVSIFSYIMGNFLDILSSYNKLFEINDESEQLARFFGILRRFN